MTQNRRILIVATLNGDPWGGSEPFWFIMALSLARQSHQVSVAWFDWPERQKKNEELVAAGCTVINLPNHRFSSNELQRQIRKWKAASILKNNIAANQYDQVIISQSGFQDVTHAPFKGLLPLLKRYILVYHNYNTARRLSARRSARLKQWIDGAILNIGDSQRIFSNMPRMAGFEVPNSAVLFNPVGFTPAVEPEPWPPLQEDHFIFMMLARLDCKSKAQDILIQTLAQAKWKDRNWKLWLYGEGKDQTTLESLIRSSGLQHKVLLKGQTDDVQSVLSQGHVLLQLTHLDAMPIAVTEAMSMARPCLVTRVGDMPDWIVDGFNGFVADSASLKSVDVVLEKAWQWRDSWQEMGLHAFSTFKQKYPVSYEEYYTRVLLDGILPLPSGNAESKQG